MRPPLKGGERLDKTKTRRGQFKEAHSDYRSSHYRIRDRFAVSGDAHVVPKDPSTHSSREEPERSAL